MACGGPRRDPGAGGLSPGVSAAFPPADAQSCGAVSWEPRKSFFLFAPGVLSGKLSFVGSPFAAWERGTLPARALASGHRSPPGSCPGLRSSQSPRPRSVASAVLGRGLAVRRTPGSHRRTLRQASAECASPPLVASRSPGQTPPTRPRCLQSAGRLIFPARFAPISRTTQRRGAEWTHRSSNPLDEAPGLGPRRQEPTVRSRLRSFRSHGDPSRGAARYPAWES